MKSKCHRAIVFYIEKLNNFEPHCVVCNQICELLPTKKDLIIKKKKKF